MVDAARLADELRAEQDHVNTQSKAKHAMEVQLGELESKLAEATDAANRGGRTAMAKLESRIRELEIELGNVQGRTGENQKGHQKAERKIKELSFQTDEDKKNQDRMTELASKLQAEDLRQQEVWLHQVEPRRVPGDEGERPPQDRRRQRAVHARAWPPLRLVQDPDGTRWTLSPLNT